MDGLTRADVRGFQLRPSRDVGFVAGSGLLPRMRSTAGASEERARLARADESFRRALDDWVVRQSAAAGIPMRDVYRSLESGREMPPGVGMTHGERLAYVSATIDLEDAQERSRRRAALRRAGVDPDSVRIWMCLNLRLCISR